ncbi:unnamed protein product [Protopolystoma xenopodis]|uniref:Ferritin n=1 Tax=Protopolystoma xenopodis TaxID=117903 RepID=A0A448WEF0_9PLAT|nr:unnamed protein product [Protopolystoma xenopodis]
MTDRSKLSLSAPFPISLRTCKYCAFPQSLLQLHAVAESHHDNHMMDFLESEYLNEQVTAIKELADYITQCERAGPGLGEYMFEKLTFKE